MKAYSLGSTKFGAAKRTESNRSALESRGITIDDEMMTKYPNVSKLVDQLLGYNLGGNIKL